MGVKPEYIDTGCELYHSCLNCPIPVDKCPLEHRKNQSQYRNAEVQRLHNEGMGVRELAVRFNLKIRAIYRIIEVKKNG